MKEYSYIVRLILVVSCFALVACEGIFIPDPIDPRIPKYTETGNDVAGALINDEIWESVRSFSFPNYTQVSTIHIWPEKDSLEVCFFGETNSRSACIGFHLTDLGIQSFNDLKKLEGEKVSLDGEENLGYYFEDGVGGNQYGTGQVYFKQVLPKEDSGIILSGTFGFTITNGAHKGMNVLYGRFDYYIDKDTEVIIGDAG
ncbi:hypothetical protein EYV94_22420 [Puteibacter caeruleilacunae]|nr:hypothetical protein EYV94_22420 [Puteibacter caeruleilacunae]